MLSELLMSLKQNKNLFRKDRVELIHLINKDEK